MSSSTAPAAKTSALPDLALKSAATAWFAVAAVGQAAFIWFIVVFYGTRTLSGEFERWNEKSLIDGHIPGDSTGNLVFAAHVLLASVITFAGLMQMVPMIRRRWPRVHRWTGRVFMVVAVFMALSGLWLAFVRGTYLSVISNVAIGINGALILAFVAMAWRTALQRRFDRHRVWAMRTFMVVSGVWFLRVGLMGWVLLNRGPAGLTEDMSGPVDTVFTFGSYLIPLALLQLWLTAQRGRSAILKTIAALTIAAATLYTAAGVFGTVMIMWGPYL